MKIARYSVAGGPIRIGRVDAQAGTVTDLSAVQAVNGSVKALLPQLAELKDTLAGAEGESHELADVVLHAPIDEPQKYLGIGMNYAEHAKEAAAAGIPIPKTQMWFNKQTSCITGPYDQILHPVISEQLDYEIELGVVIGKEAKNVSAENARDYIAGYLVANDVSVRDWLAAKSPTFTLGKSFDTHGPIGPWLTTDDEVEDPLNLRMKLSVNGEERQNWVTNDMIYDIYEQIAYLTQVFTLKPGDILATGTPAGIGALTKNFLKVGDVVRAEIEGLGHIENTVANG